MPVTDTFDIGGDVPRDHESHIRRHESDAFVTACGVTNDRDELIEIELRAAGIGDDDAVATTVVCLQYRNELQVEVLGLYLRAGQQDEDSPPVRH